MRRRGHALGGAGGHGDGGTRPPALARLLAGGACALLATSHGQSLAQDARQVAEPVAPATCAVLTANADAPRSGAAGDDTARIQAAIDGCAPGHAVRLAPSNEKRAFVAGPLALRSGVSLLVGAGATLYASTNPKLYDRGAGTCGTIDQSGKGCKPFITADGTSGSGIRGDGAIDGQGGHAVDGGEQSWWQLARRAQKEAARQNVPRLIEVTNSRDFTLHRIALRNSPNFHVTLNRVDGFTAWGVKIDTPADARNTDGIDPISSRNITIAHSHIRTGDDNVAIKAGNNGPTENISILHNHFYSGHGMSIGSETNGGVRRVLVEDLSMDGTTSGLRIKSDVSRGGAVDEVSYRDVCLRGVKTAIDVSPRYDAKAQGTLIPVYSDIAFERVRSVTPSRVVLLGYDAGHPLRASLRGVGIAGKADIRTEFAELGGEAIADGAAAGDDAACAGRFAPFPAPEAPADSRPRLTPEQASHYAYGEVLKYVGAAGRETADPWDPLADPLANGAAFTPDYIVDRGARADGVRVFHTVQQAVSRAMADSAGSTGAIGGPAQPGGPAGSARRRYLLVKPGVYRELVYIPASSPPLTMYGEGKDAAATVITARLDASNTGAAYAAQYGAQFAEAAPDARAMYASVRDRAVIGTFGTATVWVKSQGFQARGLTFENGYNKDTGNARAEELPNVNNVHHQALALQVDGADKAQFENVRLIGFQDTLYLKSPRLASTSRSFFNNSYIEGDVDFIFGDSTAYFRRTEIRSLGDRGLSYAAAPDTHVMTKYGFVFDQCGFTHDGSANALAGTFHLLRQWFHSARCTPYGAVAADGYACAYGPANGYQAPAGTVARASLEAVGKMVVLNSRIGAHINRRQPWSDWNREGTLAFRPVQYDAGGYLRNLLKAGIDPVADLGYGAPDGAAPAGIFLGEFNNTYE